MGRGAHRPAGHTSRSGGRCASWCTTASSSRVVLGGVGGSAAHHDAVLRTMTHGVTHGVDGAILTEVLTRHELILCDVLGVTPVVYDVVMMMILLSQCHTVVRSNQVSGAVTGIRNCYCYYPKSFSNRDSSASVRISLITLGMILITTPESMHLNTQVQNKIYAL